MSKREAIRKIENQIVSHLFDTGGQRLLERVELERQMIYGASPAKPGELKGTLGWSKNHEANPKYKDFTVGKINLNRHRDQRVDENVTLPSLLTYLFPHRPFARYMERKFVETVGSRAQSAMDAYENTPAYEGQDPDGPSVIEELGALMLAKESTLIAVSHAESLDDIAVNHGPVAIAAARKRSRLVNKLGTSLSKTLSIENYQGKRVPRHFKFFGVIYWTFPESDNLGLYDIPEKAVEIVRKGGSRTLMRDAEKGTSIVMAPTGSGMKLLPEADPDEGPAYGPQILDMPAMPENTLNLLRHFRHYLISATVADKVKISSIFNIPNYGQVKKESGKRLSIKEKNHMALEIYNHISEQLAQLTADSAEIPVRYRIIEKLGEAAISRLAFPRLN